jgi:hypothetical protein
LSYEFSDRDYNKRVVILGAFAIVQVHMSTSNEQEPSHHRHVEWGCIAKGIACMAVTGFLWHLNGDLPAGLPRIADGFLTLCAAGITLNELAIGVGIISKDLDIIKKTEPSVPPESPMTYDPESDEVQYSNNGAPYNK